MNKKKTHNHSHNCEMIYSIPFEIFMVSIFSAPFLLSPEWLTWIGLNWGLCGIRQSHTAIIRLCCSLHWTVESSFIHKEKEEEVEKNHQGVASYVQFCSFYASLMQMMYDIPAQKHASATSPADDMKIWWLLWYVLFHFGNDKLCKILNWL